MFACKVADDLQLLPASQPTGPEEPSAATTPGTKDETPVHSPIPPAPAPKPDREKNKRPANKNVDKKLPAKPTQCDDPKARSSMCMQPYMDGIACIHAFVQVYMIYTDHGTFNKLDH